MLEIVFGGAAHRDDREFAHGPSDGRGGMVGESGKALPWHAGLDPSVWDVDGNVVWIMRWMAAFPMYVGGIGGSAVFPVIANERLSPNVHRLVVAAPRVAKARRPGQFVIVRARDGAERIPLTIAGVDQAAGHIVLVIQAVGAGTRELVALTPGQAIQDVCGPLGHPTELVETGRAVCVGGGVGTAVVLPIAMALAARGVQVTSIIGGRSREWVICEDELRGAGTVVVCTDDGSHGRKGFVTEALKDVLAAGSIDIVYAVGPVPMMRAVCDITRVAGVKTVVSLNPVMVDGTGMCGGCRVTVGGRVRFACVDGPEFDGHQVDFAQLTSRLSTYKDHEKRAADHACRIGLTP